MNIWHFCNGRAVFQPFQNSFQNSHFQSFTQQLSLRVAPAGLPHTHITAPLHRSQTLSPFVAVCNLRSPVKRNTGFIFSLYLDVGV